MPEGAVKVDRATRFGNPFRVGADGAAAECQALYRKLLSAGVQRDAAAFAVDQERARQAALQGLARLRGHDLACWCALCARHAEGKPLGEDCDACAPCHGDVLLERANEHRPQSC
jgi:hypothetical protein